MCLHQHLDNLTCRYIDTGDTTAIKRQDPCLKHDRTMQWNMEHFLLHFRPGDRGHVRCVIYENPCCLATAAKNVVGCGGIF